MDKIIQLVKKYWSIISYLFFGVVTTVVNMVVYYLCYHLWGISSDLSTVIAWVIAVLTAFLTNKPFVFGSHDWSPKVLLPEAGFGAGGVGADAYYGRDAGVTGYAHEAAGQRNCGNSQLCGKQSAGFSEKVNQNRKTLWSEQFRSQRFFRYKIRD